LTHPPPSSPYHAQCYLYKSDKHKILARELKRRCPELVLCSYGEDEYFGETVMHIAIVNKDLAEVKFLAKHFPKLLTIRASGNFFQLGKPCYYGARCSTMCAFPRLFG
jgi:hypothetical protein